jgi:hypothetical protein
MFIHLSLAGKEKTIMVLQENEKRFEEDLSTISDLKLKNTALESDLHILKSKLIVSEKENSVLISNVEDVSSTARYVYMFVYEYICASLMGVDSDI